jgi:hypothetical protein
VLVPVDATDVDFVPTILWEVEEVGMEVEAVAVEVTY